MSISKSNQIYSKISVKYIKISEATYFIKYTNSSKTQDMWHVNLKKTKKKKKKVMRYIKTKFSMSCGRVNIIVLQKKDGEKRGWFY